MIHNMQWGTESIWTWVFLIGRCTDGNDAEGKRRLVLTRLMKTYLLPSLTRLMTCGRRTWSGTNVHTHCVYIWSCDLIARTLYIWSNAGDRGGSRSNTNNYFYQRSQHHPDIWDEKHEDKIHRRGGGRRRDHLSHTRSRCCRSWYLEFLPSICNIVAVCGAQWRLIHLLLSSP